MNPALDAAIGRRMGLEPRKQSERDSWPDPPDPKEHWPPLSSDWGWAGLMVEWMREQGWQFSLFCCEQLTYAKFWKSRNESRAAHENPATAIAHAMAAALGIEVEEQQA